MNPETFTDDIEQQQDGVPQEQVPAEPVAPKEDATAAAIRDLAASLKQQPQQQQQQQAAPELTADQKAELWAIYDPKKSKPDFMRKFFRMNPDATPEEEQEAEGLFSDMQQGLVKQAVVGARNLYRQDMQKELASIHEQYKPVLDYVSAARAREHKTQFETSYPALADEKYSGIVKTVATSLAAQQFDSFESYSKALAEGAADLIKKVLPDFDLGTVQPKQSVQTPKLPRSGAGGTGGAAGGGVPKKAGDDDSASIQWT